MTAPLTVRVATPDDITSVVALVESAYRGESSRAGWTTEAGMLGGQRTDADRVAALIAATADTAILLAEHAEGLAGCVMVHRESATTAYIGMFAVRPTAQNGGLGRALLAEAERHARTAWDATTARMTVIAQRPELIAWYERRGYARTGDTEPFPYGDERFGLPTRDDLYFVVLKRTL